MEEILTVSQLTFAIKKQLETRFPLVSVRGEISNFKEQSSGHLYFTLKDSESQLSAVLFKGNTRFLTRLPKGGDQVIVKGEINVYAPRGNYQILIRELHFEGVGELLLKFHELKNKLHSLGWFDAHRKKPLPKFPRIIGVVTSPTGAVIQDILHILNRRFSGFHLRLNPVRVQGEGAAEEIAQAIEQFNRFNLADVLIVGRGGGSLEDLWAFNEERVAAAIFASKIPIISAVGHETDTCISDYVADLRAPTPSAAAEIVLAEKKQFITWLEQAHKRTLNACQILLTHQQKRLKALIRHPLLASPYSILNMPWQKIDELQMALKQSISYQLKAKRLLLQTGEKQLKALNPKMRLLYLRQKLNEDILRRQLTKRLFEIIEQKKKHLSSLAEHLNSINPKNLLKKGYSIVFSEKDGSVILSTKDVKHNQKLKVQLSDGLLQTTINEISHV